MLVQLWPGLYRHQKDMCSVSRLGLCLDPMGVLCVMDRISVPCDEGTIDLAYVFMAFIIRINVQSRSNTN
jgi:hypothetical protein